VQSEIPTPADAGWTVERVVALVLLFLLCAVLVWKAYNPEDIYLSDLKYEVLASPEGYEPGKDQNFQKETLRIKDTFYPKGFCVKPDGVISCRFIPNGYDFFVAEVGVDAMAGENASVVFQVIADGTVLYESPVMRRDMPPRLVRVPIRGRNELLLHVFDGGDGNAEDVGNWALSRFEYR
jgi:hypothetical protein